MMAVKLSQEELNKIAAGDFGHYVEGLKPITQQPDPETPEEKKPVGRPQEMEGGRIVSVQLSYEERQSIKSVMKKFGLKQSAAIRKILSYGVIELIGKDLEEIERIDKNRKELDEKIEKELKAKEEDRTQAPQAFPVIPKPNISTVGRHF